MVAALSLLVWLPPEWLPLLLLPAPPVLLRGEWEVFIDRTELFGVRLPVAPPGTARPQGRRMISILAYGPVSPLPPQPLHDSSSQRLPPPRLFTHRASSWTSWTWFGWP